MLMDRRIAGIGGRLFTQHCRDWSRAIADFQSERLLPRKLPGLTTLGPVSRLFDLPAPEQSLKAEPVGLQTGDEINGASTHPRPVALAHGRRRGAQDHRRHPGAAGDREDPCSPAVGSAAAAQGSGARGGAELRCLSRLRCRTPIATGCGYPAGGVAPVRCVGKPWPTSRSTLRPGSNPARRERSKTCPLASPEPPDARIAR